MTDADRELKRRAEASVEAHGEEEWPVGDFFRRGLITAEFLDAVDPRTILGLFARLEAAERVVFETYRVFKQTVLAVGSHQPGCEVNEYQDEQQGRPLGFSCTCLWHRVRAWARD